MPDESLLAILENAPQEYTPEALAFANEEVSRRGGMELLKERVQQIHVAQSDVHTQRELPSVITDSTNEVAARLKKFYWIPVLAAYAFFMYIIRESLWFYWLCVFVMLAFWIRVLINARKLTPEEEYAEIAREMAEHPKTNSTDEKPSSDDSLP
jgi:hypothetical protein